MTLILSNAAVVLPDQILQGSVSVRDGVITEIQPGRSVGTDLDGDFLIAGAIDLHTDNLERQVEPRQNARWPSRAALLSHDSQCAAAGVTTVFDALCIGHAGLDNDRPRTCAEGVADLAALAPSGLLKSEHFLHLRCELPAEDLLAQLELHLGNPLLRMISLMDHTPGLGQFGDLPRYREMMRQDGLDDAAIDARITALHTRRLRHRQTNRHALLARLAGHAILLASHDDSTVQDVAENLEAGLGVSEFPVSLAAATAAHSGGMAVIAGAPNLVRGGSHSGNVSAAGLLEAGVVDALASDYVPASLVHAAFIAAGLASSGQSRGVGLPKAMALISSTPARLAGLSDRGSIAPGQRADLVRVRLHEGTPVIRQVWRAGERII